MLCLAILYEVTPSFELDVEAVRKDMEKISTALNVNIDFWAKNKYYISGIVKENNEFVLEFTKEIGDFKENLIYNAEKEELYSEYIKGDYRVQKALGASEMYLFGKFIEAIGFYNPLLPKDHQDALRINADLLKKWLQNGERRSCS